MKHLKPILLVAFIIFMLPVFLCAKSTEKPSIYNANQTQLNTSSPLIGEKKSQDIYLYVQANSIKRVSELEGKIPYVGKETIKDLEKKYK